MEGIYGSITATGMHKVLECMKHNCGLGKSSTLIDIGAGLGRWGDFSCPQHGQFLQLVSCAVCVPAELCMAPVFRCKTQASLSRFSRRHAQHLWPHTRSASVHARPPVLP